jgi:hypothetical protein
VQLCSGNEKKEKMFKNKNKNHFCIWLKSQWTFTIMQHLLHVFYIFTFSTDTTGPMWPKIGLNGPLMVPNLNCREI